MRLGLRESSPTFGEAVLLGGVIDAEFALNEGGGGRLDEKGKPLIMTVQAAEKFPQNYTLEVTNPGGHSSRPVPDNAIYRLADAIEKIRVDLEPQRRQEMMDRTGRRTVPQIYIGERHVGGYDDLAALDRAGGLDPLLAA